jgi:hypothetical protein
VIENHAGISKNFGDVWHAFKKSTVRKKSVDRVPDKVIVDASGHGWGGG